MGIHRPEWLERVEGVLETLIEGVIVSDDGARILSVNSRFEGMIAIPRAEIVGKEAYHSIPQRRRRSIAKQKERGMRQGHNRFEFVLPKKDGSRLPVIISLRAINSPDGRRFGVVTFTEISEQKRAEEQLRKANKQLEEKQKEICQRSDITLLQTTPRSVSCMC